MTAGHWFFDFSLEFCREKLTVQNLQASSIVQIDTSIFLLKSVRNKKSGGENANIIVFSFGSFHLEKTSRIQ